jgi:hypothetical protein
MAHPNHISRFNELIPVEDRHHYLLDSNIDWGQDLPALARYQEEQGIDRIPFIYFGMAPFSAYGVKALRFSSIMARERHSSDQFDPKWVRHKTPLAISINHLQGLFMKTPYFKPLLNVKPAARIGGSILVFEIDPSRPLKKNRIQRPK